MRPIDSSTGEIHVARGLEGGTVEVQIAATGAEGDRLLRLSREEARRLAALILFQAARLDRPQAGWGRVPLETERQSA